ncbi:DNA primase [Halothiobacillus diazotrophicus]|uniref:DNA primase n=1 Tax=Halothiobacillus diazotrophicus TaxID=1860122 RepID=A0A191ZIK7_9GAMM|nr:DNA primase [Halothiobacillus diazotrophicus]ANJ67687.1 DNA primase [Halothiobacillus diazotrophicus]
MSFIPESFIDDVLARTDLVELIHRQVPLKKKGREYAACCPFHQEKTPSFYVNPDKQFYHCFGCGAHGNAISFLMDYEHRDFRGAIEQLAEAVGLSLPESAADHAVLDAQTQSFQVMDRVNAHFKTQLRQHPEAIEYLKGRHLQGETAALYSIGFAPGGNALLQAFAKEPATIETLIELGLIIQKDDGERYDRFRRRIMFPIRDKRGQIRGFGGRIVGPGEPKYLNSPESPLFHKGQHVYGVYESRLDNARPNRLLIVEGYMDVVMLAQHGIRNVVATMGTATTDEQIQRLYAQTATLVFCFDGDAAGRRAAGRALQAALPHLSDGRDLRFLFLPDGEDPDSFVQQQGQAGLIELIERHSLAFDQFMLQLLDQQEPGTGTAIQARKAKTGAEWVGRLPEGALKRITLRRLNEHTGVWRAKGAQNQPPPIPQQPRKKPARYPAHTVVLAILLRHPDLLPHVLDPSAWLDGAVPEGFAGLRTMAGERLSAAIAESWDRETVAAARACDFHGVNDLGMAQAILLDTLKQHQREQADAARKQQSIERLAQLRGQTSSTNFPEGD